MHDDSSCLDGGFKRPVRRQLSPHYAAERWNMSGQQTSARQDHGHRADRAARVKHAVERNLGMVADKGADLGKAGVHKLPQQRHLDTAVIILQV